MKGGSWNLSKVSSPCRLSSKERIPSTQKLFLSVKTAKVLQWEQNGQPENVLSMKELPLPSTLQPNEVLIQWIAAPINPADVNIIEGMYGVKANLPEVGGTEGVGQIIEKGKEVKLNTLDLVIPAKPLGTWRTYSVLKQDEVLHVPSDIPLGYLATLSSPCTALRLIEDFVTLERGDTILQNGSNSSVGTAVVQIAKAKGFETVNLLRDRRTTTDDGDYVQRTKKLKRIGGLAVFPENYLGTPK